MKLHEDWVTYDSGGACVRAFDAPHAFFARRLAA